MTRRQAIWFRRSNRNEKTMISAQTISLRPMVFDPQRRLPGEAASLQAIWAASQDQDDPTGRPPEGWWSIADWATTIRVIREAGAPVGMTAIEYSPGSEVAEARLALLPWRRQQPHAETLVQAAVDLARNAGARFVRLYAPASAAWALAPARATRFATIRSLQSMLRPASDAPLPATPVAGVQIRVLPHGDEAALLAALNHAWAGTWNFRPITLAALRRDLLDQEAGMLVAVEEENPNHIVGTCHAIFNPEQVNPDGSPSAWISNLTIDLAWRGRRLGRVLLAAGMDNLRARGASSIALGVDGGDEIPLRLYQSAGFQTISTTLILEKTIESAGASSKPRIYSEDLHDRT
jgi:mycothiol synthase